MRELKIDVESEAIFIHRVGKSWYTEKIGIHYCENNMLRTCRQTEMSEALLRVTEGAFPNDRNAWSTGRHAVSLFSVSD